jgi:DNA-directed RNA polymerase sigma subunit (sigma70/sigma32)
MNQNDLRAKSILANSGEQVDGLTDREIAELMGISRGRVYQIRLGAILKIRRAILDDPELRTMAAEVCGFDEGGGL